MRKSERKDVGLGFGLEGLRWKVGLFEIQWVEVGFGLEGWEWLFGLEGVILGWLGFVVGQELRV